MKRKRESEKSNHVHFVEADPEKVLTFAKSCKDKKCSCHFPEENSNANLSCNAYNRKRIHTSRPTEQEYDEIRKDKLKSIPACNLGNLMDQYLFRMAIRTGQRVTTKDFGKL